MPRYLFTGLSPEVFPTIVTDTGTLECNPGDVVDLAGDVEHPRLVLADESHTDAQLIVATLAVVDDPAPVDDAPVEAPAPADPPPADPPTDPPPADAPADTPTSEV